MEEKTNLFEIQQKLFLKWFVSRVSVFLNIKYYLFTLKYWFFTIKY